MKEDKIYLDAYVCRECCFKPCVVLKNRKRSYKLEKEFKPDTCFMCDESSCLVDAKWEDAIIELKSNWKIATITFPQQSKNEETK